MKKHSFVFLLIIFCMLGMVPLSHATEKEDEIRKLMWEEAGEPFERVDIPEKWAGESAVIIAQMRSFYYRKPPIIAQLQFHKEYHNRIKLIDKKSVEKYAELSFLTNTSNREVLVGFKVIKPDGKEVVIDPSTAVLMEREGGGVSAGYKKIAIPNLEPGDILDYYIHEEHTIGLNSQVFYFDPVLFHLPQEYPVINQKIQFHIQRRCFVSLRSLNGAPELKVETDEENDEQIYYLEDSDRESVSEAKWFFPYRELPAVKFRAAYMSGKGQRSSDMLVGEPGEVKSEVSKKELADFLAYMLGTFQTDARPIIKHVKKEVSREAGNFEKAREGYYYYRNTALTWAEISAVSADERLEQGVSYYVDNRLQFLDKFSAFLAGMDIPYDILMVIPREISSLDDVLLEQELQYLIRVKEGNDYLYFSYYNAFRTPGEIDPDIQGAEAYYVDGLDKFANWNPERVTVPVTDAAGNAMTRTLAVQIAADMGSATVKVNEKANGYFKSGLQNGLADFYDFEEEERARYEMKEDFAGTLWMKKKLLTLRDSYLKTRDKHRLEVMKEFASMKYDFEIAEVDEFSIGATGRYEENPEFSYDFRFTTEDLISKVGPNYLIDAGKLIESQVRVEADELDREVGVYMPARRSYRTTIRIEIPEGFEVNGLEELNMNVKNDQGAFISSARTEGNAVLIETEKTYATLQAEAAEWQNIVAFLNAAHDFTQKKILLKKR